MSGEEHPTAAARFVYWPAWERPRAEFCQISPSGVVGRESRDMPELVDSEVLYSSPDGRWLLLLERDPITEESINEESITEESIERRISLWNPITKESIELPRWRKGGYPSAAVFSRSPDDVFCSCLIYLFMPYGRHMAVCRVGDAEWRYIDYRNAVRSQTATCNPRMNHPNYHVCYALIRPVGFKGKVYALISCSDELVEIYVDPFDLIPRFAVLKRNGVAVMPVYGSYLLYLVPWQGRHLYLIKLGFPNSMGFTFREVPVIEVFSFDFSARDWITVHSLRGGAVFLGDGYSLASATSQGKWSFIYYTCCHYQTGGCSVHQTLFSYRMEDGKVTSYALTPTYMDYRSSISRSCWIMPAHTEPTDSVDRANPTTEIAKAMEKDGYLRLKPRLCLDALEPCLKKCKVMGNVPVDAQGGYTMMPCSKKEKVLLCDLLPELIESIAERLPSFVDYTYFLNINRLIGSDLPRRRKKTFRPCLIYREKMENSYCIVDSNINRRVLVKIPKRVRGKSIGCCRYGWLLVEDGHSCCLYNPLTQQFIGTVGYKPKNGGFGIANLTFLGGKPTVRSPEKSSVLAMSLQFRSQGSLLEQGGAAEAGKAVCWKLGVEKFQASCNSPVLLGEDWYYLYCNFIYDYNGNLGNLGRLRLTNMEEGKFEWEVEKLDDPCQHYTRNYLTECGGELISVFIGEQGLSQLGDTWVRAFKIRGDVEKKWEEIHSLGGYCLYLGTASSISCVAETLDLADRIYFPKFYRDGLVYYSLKTMRYHYITNDQDQGEVTRYHPITMFSDCAWIIPDFSE